MSQINNIKFNKLFLFVFLLIILSILPISSIADSSIAKKNPAPNVQISISATLSKKGDLLKGKIKLSVNNDANVAINAIPLWLYPNRFSKVGKGLTDRTVNWIYPSGNSIGKIEIFNPVWNGRNLPKNNIFYLPLSKDNEKTAKNNGKKNISKVIANIKIDQTLKPGASGILEMDFLLTIPKRRGRFGRWRGVVSLAGGWFPRPMTDLTGTDTNLPFKEILANIQISLPANRGAVLHTKIFKPQQSPQTVKAVQIKSSTITVIIMDLMDITKKKFAWGQAIYISRELQNKSPTWQDTRGKDSHGFPRGIPSLGLVNYSSRAFSVLNTTVNILNKEVPSLKIPNEVIMIEIPAWDRLVQSGDGSILLSDRMWRLFPMERILSFHDVALSEKLCLEFAKTHTNKIELPLLQNFVADIIGTFLGELFATKAHGGKENIKNLVGFAAFIPYIDNLLYSPQIPFRESFSQSIEEPDPLRDEPWRFMNELPRGRRILAKIVDLIGTEKTKTLIFNYLSGNTKFKNIVKTEGSVSSKLNKNSNFFFDQWMGQYPKVNYKIVDTKELTQPNGQIKHQVTISRVGDNIIEPVTVKFVDKKNQSNQQIWSSGGNHKTLTWTSNAKLKRIILDPNYRLVESAELTDDHPMADNQLPTTWRPPLLTQFLIWGDAITFEPFIQISLSMRRKYDITNSFHLSGSYTPRSVGGSVGYLKHFGKKRTLNSRVWYLGPTLSVKHFKDITNLNPELTNSTLLATTLGSIGLFAGKDDRSYFFDPTKGFAFSTWAGYSAGKNKEGQNIHLANVSSRFFKLWSPAIGHTIATYGGASAILSTGNSPPVASLVTLSNRNFLRGFDLDETYGKVGIYGVAEYRHNLFCTSHISTASFSTLDRLQGVFFAGAGTISWPDKYRGIFSDDRLFTEIGYGLRLHLLVLGVIQYLVALDFAIPITPINRSYSIIQTDGSIMQTARNPFKLVFGITQTY